MKIADILASLCGASGVSGHEGGNALDVFGEIIGAYCPEEGRDAPGNRWYSRKNKNGKTLMIEAHADKIGLMVSHITEDGFLLFAEIGGFDRKIMPATHVTVYGNEALKGVISSAPPHLMKKQKFGARDLCIDVGYSKKQLEGKVDIGDVVEFDVEYTTLSGDKVAASAFDDRAGLAVIARCAELLENYDCNITALASVQEEVGARAAAAAAYRLQPDMYICVDACHGKTPDASDNVFQLGGGAVITVGPNVQPYMSKGLINTAKENGIPYQIDVDAGNTGTNAWAVQIARRGIPTAVVSLPLRYMHTRYEVISLTDVESCAQLLAQFAKTIDN